jgi:hypothetical protein
MYERQRYADSNTLDNDSNGAWNMLAQTLGYTVSECIDHPGASARRDAMQLVSVSMSRYARHLDALAPTRPI